LACAIKLKPWMNEMVVKLTHNYEVAFVDEEPQYHKEYNTTIGGSNHGSGRYL
jgi:hypothetical protein